MRTIPLTQGKVALVDDADYEWLNQWKWSAVKKGRCFYAVRGTERNGVQKQFRMHSEIMGTPKGMEVDHINGDSLDNRRENLRICTHAENIRNQRMRKTIKSSQFKGVSWDKVNKKWKAQIKQGIHTKNLGRFTLEVEAAEAYDCHAKQLYREFANINF